MVKPRQLKEWSEGSMRNQTNPNGSRNGSSPQEIEN